MLHLKNEVGLDYRGGGGIAFNDSAIYNAQRKNVDEYISMLMDQIHGILWKNLLTVK